MLFPRGLRVEGVTAPPFHPNCKCITEKVQTTQAERDGLVRVQKSGANPTSASRELAEFLKGYEAFRSEPYDAERTGKRLTIGYGHVIQAGETFSSITEPEAVALLLRDINKHLPPQELIDLLTASGIVLTQSQYDALASLCFNNGSDILWESKSPKFWKYLLGGNYTPEETEAHFLTYWSGYNGLIPRRIAEANMFSFGVYDSTH
jgi:GH24 family phage-related lysozyme (muramidase)